MKNKLVKGKKMEAGHNQIRQGDVMLLPIQGVPAGAEETMVRGGRMILALGEVTGHHHSIAKKTGRQFKTDQATIIEVADALAELVHQEHSTIPVGGGAYEVRLQREYHPEAIRRVAD